MAVILTKKNYLADVVWIIGFFIGENGNMAENGNARYTETFIAVIPGRRYILSGHSSSLPLWDRVHGYNENREWVRQIAKLDWYGDFTNTIEIPSGCPFIRISTEIERITQVQMYDA